MLEIGCEAFVTDVTLRYGQDLLSIMSYPEAFAPAGVVVVFRNEMMPFWRVVAAISQHTPPDLVINCVRMDELDRLWLPSPRTFDRDAAIMPRLRDRGRVLFGEKAWADPPVDYRLGSILTAQLELATHFGRNHTIISELMTRRYKLLAQLLQETIRQLLAAGLISAGRWEFYRSTVRDEFQAAFRDHAISTLLRDFDLAVKRAFETDQSSQEAHMVRCCFLVDSIARRLWTYSHAA